MPRNFGIPHTEPDRDGDLIEGLHVGIALMVPFWLLVALIIESFILIWHAGAGQ